ncbi:hypothetical protein GRX01_00330 [Halobaculum sp. WSA2]|uniref:Uncharacterized protein n=1 Tax=Halobaculum saliterrae TaxID=2073113 RepID=A0A6B0SLN5_9EURY|nr:hypothetical protein [Halobaculum saliterrae]MXR39808.1 hypothetical protein [Halobaculum saliterrae]
MAYQEFDAEDIGALVLAIFSAAVMVGIAQVSAFGVSMSDGFSIAGIETTIAWLVTVGTFAAVVVTNDHTDLLSADGLDKMREDMDDVYAYAVVGSAALLVGWVLFPEVADFFKSTDLWGVFYIAGVAVAQVGLGWMR